MEKNPQKRASGWLRWAAIVAFAVGVTVAGEIVSSSGLRCFPSISLSANRTYTLRIKGRPGLRFRGVVYVTTADGKTDRHKVDGIAPKSFKLFGKSVSMTITKCQECGSLEATVARSGETFVEKRTTESYGSISIDAD